MKLVSTDPAREGVLGSDLGPRLPARLCGSHCTALGPAEDSGNEVCNVLSHLHCEKYSRQEHSPLSFRMWREQEGKKRGEGLWVGAVWTLPFLASLPLWESKTNKRTNKKTLPLVCPLPGLWITERWPRAVGGHRRQEPSWRRRSHPGWWSGRKVGFSPHCHPLQGHDLWHHVSCPHFQPTSQWQSHGQF